MPAPKNLVWETSTTTGTGNLTTSAVAGHVRFSDSTYGFGTGVTTNVFDYFISHRSAAEWERGTGHMSAVGTLVRDTVLESSNANAAVNFSAGDKDITNDLPADKQVTTDTAQTLSNKTFVDPALGTPVSGDLANCTNYPSPVTQDFTASGTYTRSAGVLSVDIALVGGGGGSVGATGASSQIMIGQSGGGGGTSYKHIDFVLRAITGVTKANPAVVTSNAHGFQNGTVIRIASVVGMTELNGNTYTLAGVTTNTFQLSATNSTGYGTYTSGGTADFVSCPVTVGNGGAAGSSGGGGDASDGGASTFGDYCTGNGGTRGIVAGSIAVGTSMAQSGTAAGGSASGGDVNISGSPGMRSARLSGTVSISSGNGGASQFGNGGRQATGDGVQGDGYGSGAAGAVAPTTTVRAGAAGQPGRVMVTENYW